MDVTNSLACYCSATITAGKCFIVQATDHEWQRKRLLRRVPADQVRSASLVGVEVDRVPPVDVTLVLK